MASCLRRLILSSGRHALVPFAVLDATINWQAYEEAVKLLTGLTGEEVDRLLAEAYGLDDATRDGLAAAEEGED